jgi:hypothetical protein
MMCRRQFLRAGPLNVVDDVAAVLAAVQIHRDKARLRRHEPGALDHQRQNLVLVLRRQLDGGDLGAQAGIGANVGHGALLLAHADNAWPGGEFRSPPRATAG